MDDVRGDDRSWVCLRDDGEVISRTQNVPDEEMASMRDGSGDDYSIVFSATGAFVRGFDHESPDGSTFLFDLLSDDRPEAYQQFAEEYYEVQVNLEAVRHIYALHALTPDVVAALNPDVSVADLEEDRQAIGGSFVH